MTKSNETNTIENEKDSKKVENEVVSKESTSQENTEHSKEEVEGELGKEVEEKENKLNYKAKRLVKKRKSVGKTDPLEQAIRLTLESGKVIMGYRQSMDGINSKKAKVVLIASNAKKEVIDAITTVANTTETPTFKYVGTTLKLGTICGKPYPVSILSIVDEGTSNILDILNKQNA